MSAQKRRPKRKKPEGHFVLVKHSGTMAYFDWMDGPIRPRASRRKKGAKKAC